MNCEDFKFAIGAEPNTKRPEVLEHAAACPACARMRADALAFDQRILEALQVDVARVPTQTAVRRPTVWRMAASVLVAALLVGTLWFSYPRETLAKELVSHVLHEPHSLVTTDVEVGSAELRATLAKANVSLRDDALAVSYVATCPFRGHRVPHLVVQTSQGPVTAFVLVNEPATREPRSFEEGEFAGTILPAPRGVIAVLGRDAPVNEAAQRVLAALQY